jgi:hypothetical protein
MSVQTNNSGSTILLSVGGIGVSLECTETHLLRKLIHRYRHFPLTGEVHFGAQLRVDQGWVGVADGEQVLEFKNRVLHISTGRLRGSINGQKRNGDLLISNNCPVEEIEYYLRAVYSLLAFQMGGLLLHSAGVIHNGMSFLFFGHSGSGKTTIATLSRDDVVINDDLVLLKPLGKKWIAYATPFWNPGWEEVVNASAPIVALFRLVKDQQVKLEEMEKSVAMAELVANVPVIPADYLHANELLSRCSFILDRVNAYWLHFRKDQSFWDTIEEISSSFN